MRWWLFFGLAISLQAQTSPTIEEAWDALLPDALPGLTISAPPSPTERSQDFRKHFYLEERTEYWRYSTSFTGLPTVTGVINAPITGVFNPGGIPYPLDFQPVANRLFSTLDLGTTGWLSDRLNTHFTVRENQDLTAVLPGAPATSFLETFGGNHTLELINASVEVKGNGIAVQLGRQSSYGLEAALFDGASITVNRSFFSATVFGGRRYSYFSNPDQRALGGANVTFRLGREATLEYAGLWYLKGDNSLIFRKRFGRNWQLSSYLRAYGGAPVDFSAQAGYSSGNGKTTMRLSFFQKLTNRDYFYDYSVSARDLEPHNPLVRLNLGPISQYTQTVVDLDRVLTRRMSVGGSLWIHRLNDSKDQGPFDASFQDYQAHAQMRSLFLQYHQHNSDRLSAFTSNTFDDIQAAGETSVKDFTANLQHNFREGRLGLSGGAYYRRISLQDQFLKVQGAHQSGFLAGGWARVDAHSRLFADYSLDNDFFVFRPSIQNSRLLRVGMSTKW